MKHVVIAAVATLLAAGPIAPPHDYPIRAVPLTAVTIDDGFWAPKLEINRTVTIPHILKENDDTGRVANFEKASRKKSGPYEGRRFNDTDVYKIIEAASYSLALVPDPRLSTKLDELIHLRNVFLCGLCGAPASARCFRFRATARLAVAPPARRRLR